MRVATLYQSATPPSRRAPGGVPYRVASLADDLSDPRPRLRRRHVRPPRRGAYPRRVRGADDGAVACLRAIAGELRERTGLPVVVALGSDPNLDSAPPEAPVYTRVANPARARIPTAQRTGTRRRGRHRAPTRAGAGSARPRTSCRRNRSGGRTRWSRSRSRGTPRPSDPCRGRTCTFRADWCNQDRDRRTSHAPRSRRPPCKGAALPDDRKR